MQRIITPYRIQRDPSDSFTSYNFVSAHPIHKGCFRLQHDELLTFFEAYCDYVVSPQAAKDPLVISERVFEYSPLFIDIDIKKSETTQRLTPAQVREILMTYLYVVKGLVDIDPLLYEDVLQVYYLEKEDSDQQDKCGFHAQFPFLFLHQDAIKTIHLTVIAHLKKDHLLDNFGLPYAQIIDDTSRKCWCLYGSVSKLGKNPYRLRDIFDLRGNSMTLQQSLTSKIPHICWGDDLLTETTFWNRKPLEWFLPLILSAHINVKTEVSNKPQFRNYNLFANVSKRIEEQRLQKEREQQERRQRLLNEDQEIDESKLLSFDHLQQLCDLLTHQSVNDHKLWFCVGSAIFTETKGSKQGLQLFCEVSSRTTRDNYSEDACIQKWTQFDFGYLDHHFLFSRALKDNPKQAKQLQFISVPESSPKPAFSLSAMSPKRAQELVAPIQPHLVIHKPKLDPDSYLRWFQEHKFLCLQSAMSTGKTHILKMITALKDPVVYQNYHSILIICNRIALGEEYLRQLKEYRFAFYKEEDKRFITADRVICQIDSLPRITRRYDLVICDEIETTLFHLIDFVQDRKKVCWNYLCSQLHTARYVLFCDALLTQDTIDILSHQIHKTPYIIQNTYTPCTGLTIRCISSKVEITQLILTRLEAGKKVVVPTNSCAFASELAELVTNTQPTARIALITGDIKLSERIPVTQWNQYDIVIYTSTINAGISFDQDYFDTRICYFGNNSAPAKSCVQMVFRVRQTREPIIYVCCDSTFSAEHYITDQAELEDLIQHRHRLDKETYCRYHVLLDHLEVNMQTMDIEKDSYYYAKLYVLLEENRSKRFFLHIFAECLRMHGMTLEGFDEEIERRKQYAKTPLSDEQQKLLEHLKDIKSSLKEEDIQAIEDADLLTEAQYEELELLPELTKHQQYALEKFYLAKTYDLTDDQITFELIQDLRDKKKAYRRAASLCELSELQDIIRYYVKEHRQQRKEVYQHIYDLNIKKGTRELIQYSNNADSQELRELFLQQIQTKQKDSKKTSFTFLEFDLETLRCIYAIELLQALGVTHFRQTDPFVPNFERVYAFLLEHQKDQKALFGSKADWKEAMDNAIKAVEKKNEPIRAKNEVIRLKNEDPNKKGRKAKERVEHTVWTEGTLKRSIITSVKSILDSVYGIDLRSNEDASKIVLNYSIQFTLFNKWNLNLTRSDNLKARHTRLLV